MQQHKTKLFADGVHPKDYDLHKNWYQNCVECCVEFDNGSPPSLLACGHVCCQVCLKHLTPCIACKQKKILKIPQYNLLLKNQIIPPTADSLYDFHIGFTISFNRAVGIRNQKPSTTFQQLLTQFADFNDYEKRLGERVGIAIQTKTFPYVVIKDRPISQYLNWLKPNHMKASNKISILDRFLGGKES